MSQDSVNSGEHSPSFSSTSIAKITFPSHSSESESSSLLSTCRYDFSSLPPPSPHPVISDLYITRSFLSPIHQSHILFLLPLHTEISFPPLLSSLSSSANQFMSFSSSFSVWLDPLLHPLENYLLKAFHSLPSSSLSSSPTSLSSPIFYRDPLFDQLIINVYHPGEGIKKHIDLYKFHDGIVGIVIGSSCVMKFTRKKRGDENVNAMKYDDQEEEEEEEVIVPLHNGDLYILLGESRYEWSHEIPSFSPSGVLKDNGHDDNCLHHKYLVFNDEDRFAHIDGAHCLCHEPRLSFTFRKMIIEEESGLCIVQRGCREGDDKKDNWGDENNFK